MIERNFVEIQGTFLIKVQDNAFNGAIEENVFEHINKFLEVVGPIKINGVSQNQFRLSTFLISLAGATGEWFKGRLKAIYLTSRHPCVKLSTILTTSLKLTRTGTYKEYELNNPVIRDLEEPWLDNGVTYQLCDHICQPYRFKNRITKWPTCSSNIDGFCNGGELHGMVRVGSMTYFQDHKWYDKLADGMLKEETLMHKAKVKESWGNATPMDDPTLEPSVCKIRRFEMMKYSFNVDKDYIAIKEFEYLNHSKDSLDAYQELLRIINEGWVVTTTDEENHTAYPRVWNMAY
nr:hypothetical protein [Tanacetum cinerariifolium]